jgi:hypothetical protein
MAVKKANTNSFWGTFGKKIGPAIKSGLQLANEWEMQQFQKAMQEAANKRAEAQEGRAAEKWNIIDKPIGESEVAWTETKYAPEILQKYKDFTLSDYDSGISENRFNTQLYDRYRQPDYFNPMIDSQISGFTSDLWGNRANTAESAASLGRGSEVGLSPNAPIQLTSDYKMKTQQNDLRGQELDLEQKQYQSLITNALIGAGIPESTARHYAAQLAADTAEAKKNESMFSLDKSLYDSLAGTDYNKNRMGAMIAAPGLETEATRLGNELTEAQIWNLRNPQAKSSGDFNVFGGGWGTIDKDTLTLLNKQYEYDRNKAVDDYGNPVAGYENFPTNFLEYLIEYDPGVFFAAAPTLGVADPQKYYNDYMAWKYPKFAEETKQAAGDQGAIARQNSQDKVNAKALLQNLLQQTGGNAEMALAALQSSKSSMRNVSGGVVQIVLKELQTLAGQQRAQQAFNEVFPSWH